MTDRLAVQKCSSANSQATHPIALDEIQARLDDFENYQRRHARGIGNQAHLVLVPRNPAPESGERKQDRAGDERKRLNRVADQHGDRAVVAQRAEHEQRDRARADKHAERLRSGRFSAEAMVQLHTLIKALIRMIGSTSQ